MQQRSHLRVQDDDGDDDDDDGCLTSLKHSKNTHFPTVQVSLNVDITAVLPELIDSHLLRSDSLPTVPVRAMSCGSGLWLMLTDTPWRSALQFFSLTCLGGVALWAPVAVPVPGPKLRIVPVAGDGNCLFRAVARGENGTEPLRPKEEDARSKELRAKAVAELVRQRKEIEWAIEGNFDSYVRRMSRNGEWGGEPELLMLSKAGNRGSS